MSERAPQPKGKKNNSPYFDKSHAKAAKIKVKLRSNKTHQTHNPSLAVVAQRDSLEENVMDIVIPNTPNNDYTMQNLANRSI